MEQKMDALHKMKSSHFKKTMEVCKRGLGGQGHALLLPGWPLAAAPLEGAAGKNAFSVSGEEEEGVCLPLGSELVQHHETQHQKKK